MVSSTRRAINCIVVLFSVVVLAYAQSVPSKELTSTISGKVIAKGKGVPGIVVGMRRNEQATYRSQMTTYRGVTDEKGEYKIMNVPAGNYSMWASAPAYVSTDELGGKVLMVEKGEAIENVDFTLVRGAVITGKVSDADGRPVIEEDVAVMPVLPKGVYRNYSQLTSARTDDRGIYRIYGLPAGSYRVGAGQDEENSYPGGRSRASFKRTYHPATLDLKQATVIEVTEGSEATNVDITLSRALTTFSAGGRIVNADTGEPIAGLNYGVTHFINPSSTSSWGNGAVSNARGEFKLEGLIPGQYAITVRPTGENDWRADQVRFEIADQDVTDLVIKARQGASLSGVVILEGVDDKAVREQLYQTGLTASVAGEAIERPWSNWTLIKPDGSFRIGGLQAGLASFFFPNSTRFRLARVEQNDAILPKSIEIKDGQHLTGLRVIVNYANASLRGLITLENGPMPESGRFYVQIRKAGEDPRYVSGESPAQVDSRGLFLIEGLMPGAYVLSVGLYVSGASPMMLDAKQDVVVTGGITTNVNVTLDLKKASKLRP